jgi:ELWxxDGT repeat protein
MFLSKKCCSLILSSLALTLVCQLSLAQTTHLLKDLSKVPSSSNYTLQNPELVGANGITYFNAYTNSKGVELWKTDGTEDGTRLVKDIAEGPGSSYPRKLTNVNGTLFFIADDQNGNAALWKTDGTEAGTQIILTNSIASNIDQLTNLNGTLFFVATTSAAGSELWKSDGTAAGTGMVADIRQGASNSGINNLIVSNGVLYFSANNGASGTELFRSDGTSNGTYLVKDIRNGTGGGLEYVPAFTDINGVLYFMADNGIDGYEPWKSDGTNSGTVMVANVFSGSGSSYPEYFTNINGTIFFAAMAPGIGYELFKTDGTNGASLVKDLATGTGNGVLGNFCALNNLLIFYGTDGQNQGQLWRSDGTDAGTVMLNNKLDGDKYPQYPINFNGKIFFTAQNNLGIELWSTDGTEAGTEVFKDIYNGQGSSSPVNLTTIGNRLFFLADDGLHGKELWSSDGTAEHTSIVKDVANGTTGSKVSYNLTTFQNQLVFQAQDEYYQKLWKSDGTADGTVILSDADVSGGIPQFQVTAGSNLFFTTTNNQNTILWVSDGTTSTNIGTFKNLFNNTSLFSIVNNGIYFAADDGVNGVELWKSDGTAAGTIMVKDILKGSAGSNPSQFYLLNNILFFQADNGSSGEELWKSDGTEVGTVMVKEIRKNSGSSNPNEFAALNGILYFAAEDDDFGRELWRSDGTDNGTYRVKDIATGTAYSFPNNLVVYNNAIYFSAWDAQYGYELWKSDGTEGGTNLVIDIFEGPDNSWPNSFTTANGTLFFLAENASNGAELWKSDGTLDGTSIVADLTPGSHGSTISNLFSYNNKLFFTFNNQLWKSEGGTCNTLSLSNSADVLVTDWVPFQVINNKMFFVGITEETGDELFYYDFSNVNNPGCTQQISFESIPDKSFGDPVFYLQATATSKLALTFTSSDPTIAKVEGNKVTLTGIGHVTITASQAGDINYAAASAEHSFQIRGASLQLFHNDIQTSPLTLSFNNVLKGTSASDKFTIKNIGDLDLNIASITPPPGFSVDKTSAIVATGQSIEITITFSPTAVQDYNSNLEIISDVSVGASTGQTLVGLTGKGVLITAIEPSESAALVQVYPNPSADIFKVKILSVDQEKATLQVYNAAGESLNISYSMEGSNVYVIDLKGKPTGIYFLAIQSEKKVLAVKILKY